VHNNYFEEYTGNKDHGKGSDTFDPIHNTRVRVNYTYYNSPDVFQKIIDWYERCDPYSSFDYTVIDDGSQDSPITNMTIPNRWRVLRIDKDYGWNNEGARNCLMKDSSNEWNLILDSDWVIDALNLNRIRFQIARGLKPQAIYLPGNFGYRTIRNSFLVNKDTYWKIGGYDQAFVGYHGVDYSFLRLSNLYDRSDFFRFERIVDDVVDPKDKNRFEEVKRFHKRMEELELLGLGKRNPEDKQDFVWRSKEDQMKYWTALEYEVIQ
jgi:hypothetical protein